MRRSSKYSQLKQLTLNTSSPASVSVIPMPVDVTTSAFYTIITELYTKYASVIRENIKKIYTPSIDKMVLRMRSMTTGNSSLLPVSNNVYVELPPVFRIVGLLMPYLSSILQVDMYGMFEQLSNLSDSKPLTDVETKLIKMTIMNDVKILDLNDMPLTYEQQMNVLVFLNIFYHAVSNSLFQIGREQLPKMIEQNLLTQFNSIIETKFKLPCTYHKLNEGDPYHVKVLRKLMLAFGIRPCKYELRNVPAAYKSMFNDSSASSSSPVNFTSSADCTASEIEEFVDSVTVSYSKLDSNEYLDSATKELDIGKFLETNTKIVQADGKLYWSKFKRAYGLLPVYIERRDVYKKKAYEQLLVSNVQCCETRFNTRKIRSANLFCPNPLSSATAPTAVQSAANLFASVAYFPLAVMGVFIENSEISGAVEDVEFLYLNPYTLNNTLNPNPTGYTDKFCPGLRQILIEFDNHFFCQFKPQTTYDGCTSGAKSFSEALKNSSFDSGCCDSQLFKEFKDLLENNKLGLLFLSNKSCLSPIFVSFDGSTSTEVDLNGTKFKVIRHSDIECLVQASATAILYVTDVKC